MNILVDYAMSFLGKPYRWGGDDPILGFDCSGLIQEILASVGEDPPGDQTADSLYRYFKTRGNIRDVVSAYPGDLAFYGTPKKITHVSFCLDHGRCIEAAGGNESTKTTADASRQNAYVRIRPIRTRKDLVNIIAPPYKLLTWND